MKKINRTWVVVAVLAFSGAVYAGKAAAKSMVVLPYSEAKWFPIDPKNPEGPQLAVASGDPQKGPSAVYLKLKKGSAGIHSHTADYHAVLVSGTARHWDGEDGSQAKELNAGSYWFQPGKKDHGDECVSDECVIFLQLASKFDFIPARAPTAEK